MTRTYLDWNATAPVRPEAREAALKALDLCGNPSSIHQEGREARRVRESAREAAARWLGISPEAITFTSGGTESNAAAIHGLFRTASSSRRILASATEHPSVLENARLTAARFGGELVLLPVDRKGALPSGTLERELAKGAALVSVHAANNETGVLFPVDEIVHQVRAAGVPVHVDATQWPGRLPLPSGLWGADLLTFSGHKLGALKGAGMLVNPGRRPLEPLIAGGPQERGRRAGTENLAAIASLGAAIEAIRTTGEAEFAHLAALDRWMTGRLAGSPWKPVTGGAPRLPNTWNLTLDQDAEPVIQALDLEGFAVSSGSACSSGSVEPSHVLLAMGLSPAEARRSLRISAGRLTTTEDLENVLKALERVCRR